MPNNKKIYITFGRMNPPHVGHMKVINKGIANASNKNADFMAFVTRSYTKKSNPLSPNLKVAMIKELYKNKKPDLQVRHVQTLTEAYKLLKNAGYTDIEMVVGGNRRNNFGGSGSKSVVPREATNISATEIRNSMRKAASFENFLALGKYPENFNRNLLRTAYNRVRNPEAPNSPVKKRKATPTPKRKAAKKARD